MDYVLPRSESLEYDVPWNIDVTIKSKSPISTVYSPSHDIVTERFKPSSDSIAGETAKGVMKVRLSESASREPGPFLLSYLLETREISASLFGHLLLPGFVFVVVNTEMFSNQPFVQSRKILGRQCSQQENCEE